MTKMKESNYDPPASRGATMKNQSGFTIVELLIVVIIIAILASITIVSYNGIQNRAKISRQATDISSFKKGIEAYKAVNNSVYPPSSSVGLGSSELRALAADTKASAYSGDPVDGWFKDKYYLWSNNESYSIEWWDYKAGMWKMYRSSGEELMLGTGSEPYDPTEPE